MKFIGETLITAVEGLRAVGRDGDREPRMEITFTTADGRGVFILPARQAALLRDYIAQGLKHLQA
ncbi:hypothetical protein [Brevundimonas aurantiaca]|jgi:hypothetical protein|uniref:hypothetical protein n=1 Tax=Brevundimonas aurantiaca TaxID=74316 RepID=UPI00191B38E4|nr:hypothetical protein [Brevundimonas aurantiaca]